MADTKISALAAIDAVATGDQFAANDVSASASKKVTAAQLLDFIFPKGFVVGGTLSNAGGDATNDITIQVFTVQDEGGGGVLTISSERST